MISQQKLHVVRSKIFKIGEINFPYGIQFRFRTKSFKIENSKLSKVGEIEHHYCTNSASISSIFQNSEVRFESIFAHAQNRSKNEASLHF